MSPTNGHAPDDPMLLVGTVDDVALFGLGQICAEDMPPNDANHPYTLFMYTDDGNFLAVCDASRTTGLDPEQLLSQRRQNSTASFGISSSESVAVKVGLSAAEAAGDAQLSRVNRVELSLLNGKIYTLPAISITDVVQNIQTSNCGSDASFYLAENPDAKFVLPTAIFGYDIGYRILTSDNVDVTARLPPHLTQSILTKVGVGYSRDSRTDMVGNGLYVGFRGTAITNPEATLGNQSPPPASSLAQHTAAMAALARHERANLATGGLISAVVAPPDPVIAPSERTAVTLESIDKLIDVTAVVHRERAN